jgi:hypothetical protein
MYIGLHANYPLFLPDFNENLILLTDFRIIPSIKFCENPSCRKRIVPCGRTDINRQTYKTKQIIHFRDIMNAPKNYLVSRPTKVRKFAAPQ